MVNSEEEAVKVEVSEGMYPTFTDFDFTVSQMFVTISISRTFEIVNCCLPRHHLFVLNGSHYKGKEPEITKNI